MISASSFRQDYAEFSNQALYPNSVVNYWIQVASLLLNTVRWGAGSLAPAVPANTIYDVASELFVAHNLAIERLDQKAAQSGATPGVSKGPVSAESVGSVSRSYDTASALEPDAGQWNLTNYGTRLKRLMGYFGAGPIQVGAACGLEGGGWFCEASPAALVPAVGSITFTANPTPGSTITLGETMVTFVGADPEGDEVLVGANLQETTLALVNFLSTSDDPSISACYYGLSTPAPPAVVLNIIYKEIGPTGNTFAIATTVPGSAASGPTLVGPVKTNVGGIGENPWVGPPPWPGVTMFG